MILSDDEVKAARDERKNHNFEEECCLECDLFDTIDDLRAADSIPSSKGSIDM